MCGIGPKHIRLLCNNSWEGGYQYTPNEVGDMTLDQVMLLLCDKDVLRSSKRTRVVSQQTLAAPAPGPDGLIAGRDAEGNPIRLPIKGESLASRLNREWEAKQEQERQAKKNQAAKAERRRKRQKRRKQ